MTQSVSVSTEKSLFEPRCLTVNIGSECNLTCSYCYAKDIDYYPSNLHPELFEAAFESACRMVAGVCLKYSLPFHLGFQGRGEPLMHFELLQRIVSIAESICAVNGLPLDAYICSNGTQERELYRWISDHFRQICFSVDGDTAVHDTLRIDPAGSGQLTRIRDNINLVRACGRTPVCRSTITPFNVGMQSEMVLFLCKELGFSQLQFEPVYSTNSHLPQSLEAEQFVGNYLKAQSVAGKLGCNLSYSGYRPWEKHGPYCNPTRDVLFLTRNGDVSVCLFHDFDPPDSPYIIGQYDQDKNAIILNSSRITQFKECIGKMDSECVGCVIKEHCVRGCPDVCVINGEFSAYGSLRCRINRLLHGIS